MSVDARLRGSLRRWISAGITRCACALSEDGGIRQMVSRAGAGGRNRPDRQGNNVAWRPRPRAGRSATPSIHGPGGPPGSTEAPRAVPGGGATPPRRPGGGAEHATGWNQPESLRWSRGEEQ